MSGKSKQTILVIDDMPDTVLLVSRRLKDLDVEVTGADCGEAGLKEVARSKPDLILLDVSMPGMSGFDVIRELKGDEEVRDIPVIFLTCADAKDDMITGLDMGAVDYVIKPFDPAVLRARVSSALRSKDLMDMLTIEAEIDGLTGLHNRRYFDRHLKREIAACRRYGRELGLLLIDVDRFKQINDTYGHPKGDQVLRRFGEILKSTCRDTDLPCRFGGDEFAVLMPETPTDRVHVLAKRIRRVVGDDKELAVALPEHTFAISIGGAGSSGLGELTPERLMDRADGALYAVKASGRDGYRVADHEPGAGSGDGVAEAGAASESESAA